MKFNFTLMFFSSMFLMLCTPQEDDRWTPRYSNYDPEIMNRENYAFGEREIIQYGWNNPDFSDLYVISNLIY